MNSGRKKFDTVFKRTDAHIAPVAQKTSYCTCFVAVVNAEGFLRGRRVSTNSANAILFCDHFVKSLFCYTVHPKLLRGHLAFVTPNVFLVRLTVVGAETGYVFFLFALSTLFHIFSSVKFFMRDGGLGAENDPRIKGHSYAIRCHGRRQKVHDKPFCDRLIHACSCTGGQSRHNVAQSVVIWHKVGKSLRLQPMTSTKPCPCCLMYRSTHVQATPMNQFTLPYHKMRKMQVFF